MKSLKKVLCSIITVGMIFSAATITASAAGLTATPTSSTVYVSNQKFAFQAYTINGNNYFKLRDIAMVLSNTPERFSVNWDASRNAIDLLTNQYYTPVGGELTVPAKPVSVTATQTTANVYLNGVKINLTAYLIGENNYFKLRDIGLTLDFGVNYDAKYDIINIDPSKGYIISAFLEILPNAGYNPVAGTIHSYDTNTGYILITQYNDASYNISAFNISDTHDINLFQNVLSVLVSTPTDIITALNADKGTGTKTMTLDYRTITYYFTGDTRSVDIQW